MTNVRVTSSKAFVVCDPAKVGEFLQFICIPKKDDNLEQPVRNGISLLSC